MSSAAAPRTQPPLSLPVLARQNAGSPPPSSSCVLTQKLVQSTYMCLVLACLTDMTLWRNKQALDMHVRAGYISTLGSPACWASSATACLPACLH